MATEFELKYRATPAQQAAIRAAYPDGYVRIPMTTTYYDTPRGELSEKHWTLRHRQEGETHICTLKTPGDDGARGEWEIRSRDILASLDALSELSGLPLPRELVAICGARFERLAKKVQLPECTAELALDSGSLLNGGKELAFAEVELELKSGSRQALVAFAEGLAKEFALEPEPRSKFARARSLGQEG